MFLVRPNEGDAYPLGALPIGTQVHAVEKYPGIGGFLVHSAGTYATILRKTENKHVVIMTPSKKEFRYNHIILYLLYINHNYYYSLPQECMCTVGKLSNADHINTPIGSAQKNRELGNRPRSGKL